MNYEQKYKEALERASHIKDNNTVATPQQVAEFLFPELKESEDERIRKEIIAYLDVQEVLAQGKDGDFKEWIAWLEKQEQKLVISDDALREGIAHFGITQYQIDNWLKKYVDIEKQGEQKPTWSEEDENMREAVIDVFVNNTMSGSKGSEVYSEEIDWLKSLKLNRWKPSEEQMRVLQIAIRDYGICHEKCVLESLYNNLKNL